MRTDRHSASDRNGQPVFGLILLGGPLSGALVRDIRLANELIRRGFRVHVFWAMDQTDYPALDSRVEQHWLFHAGRYCRPPALKHLGKNAMERFGRLLNRIYPVNQRIAGLQKRPQILDHLMTGMIRTVCDDVANDTEVVHRFAEIINRHRVTHILPMLAVLCPWVAAVRPLVNHPLRYLVTFQGYELYVNYARHHGMEQQLYERLRGTVETSNYPALAVSKDYRRRVNEDIGVHLDRLVAIPPGVPIPEPADRQASVALIREVFNKEYKEDEPLITYVGRRDSEKGVDLLLYAAAILRKQGVSFQLAICGPTLFGRKYADVCQEIAENLRCPVLWRRQIPDELRTALFAGSYCLVYPSIHREPFGMVPVEAMAYGTPVAVPDQGGVAEVVDVDGSCGGIRFKAWDSGSLADALQQLLTDRMLHDRLSQDGPKVAANFSVAKLGDRVLSHMNLPLDASP